jgi:hypothetical protein
MVHQETRVNEEICTYYVPTIVSGLPNIREVRAEFGSFLAGRFAKIEGYQGAAFMTWQEAGKWLWDQDAKTIDVPRITIKTFRPDQYIVGETIESMKLHPSDFSYFIDEHIAEGTDYEFATINEVFFMEARVTAKVQGCMLRIVVHDDPEGHLTVYFDKDARTMQEYPAVFTRFSECLDWLL